MGTFTVSNEILNSDEWAQVKKSIAEAESRTNAEIVVAIYPSCNTYEAVLAKVFVLSSLATAVSMWFYEQSVLWEPLPSWQALFVPFAIAIVSILIVWPEPIRRLLVSGDIRRHNAEEAAKKHFFENGLFETKERNAVLVFVSKWERQIVVLGDKGINGKVTLDYWDDAAKRLAIGIRTNRFAAELCSFVSSMGDILAQHFPRTSDDVNELNDAVQGPSQS
jgi:putative membrane protein